MLTKLIGGLISPYKQEVQVLFLKKSPFLKV